MRARVAAAACALAAAAGAGAAAGGMAAAGGDAPRQPPATPPDTVLHSGRITTLDARGSTVEALAVRAGEIVAAGADEDVRALAGPRTRQIDLRGRRVLPGLVDGHLHAVGAGAHTCFSRSPRFDALFKRSEALLDVADRAARTPAGRWLFQVGAGWHVRQFDVPGMPTRAELDAFAPSHPVYLEGRGLPGGGGQLNTPAMRRLGLTARSRGVVLDASGRPTGQVTGAANRGARRAVARDLDALGPADREACTRHLVRELNRRGLTAWDDPGGTDPFRPGAPVLRGAHGLQAVNRLHRAGALHARVRVNFDCPAPGGTACVRRQTAQRISETGDDGLRIGGLGEEVLAPGRDGVHPRRAYLAILTRLARDGWSLEQLAARSTTQHGMVAAWEAVAARRPIAELRWRMITTGGGPIEPNEDALARVAELGAGIVPIAAGAAGGPEHPPLRRIHDGPAPACLGSDGFATGPYPPFVRLWYAVGGRTSDPERGGVPPSQRLTRRQALELATTRCGWFLGLEDRIGSLAVGRLADLVVLDADYFTVPVERIRTLTSVLTMVGGRIVYGAGPYARLEAR